MGRGGTNYEANDLTPSLDQSLTSNDIIVKVQTWGYTPIKLGINQMITSALWKIEVRFNGGVRPCTEGLRGVTNCPHLGMVARVYWGALIFYYYYYIY